MGGLGDMGPMSPTDPSVPSCPHGNPSCPCGSPSATSWGRQRPLMTPWLPQYPLPSLGTPHARSDPEDSPTPRPPPRDAVPPTISHHQLYWAPKKGGMRKINPKEALCGRAAVTVTGGGWHEGTLTGTPRRGGQGGSPRMAAPIACSSATREHSATGGGRGGQ